MAPRPSAARNAAPVWNGSPETSPRSDSTTSVSGLTVATAWTQPSSRSSGTNTGARNSARKVGVCISGAGLDRAEAQRDARRPHQRREVHAQPEQRHAEQLDDPAVDLHAGGQRDANSSASTNSARTSAASA